MAGLAGKVCREINPDERRLAAIERRSGAKPLLNPLKTLFEIETKRDKFGLNRIY